MAACQQRLMHGLQEYLGLDVSGVDVAVTRHFEKDEKNMKNTEKHVKSDELDKTCIKNLYHSLFISFCVPCNS